MKKIDAEPLNDHFCYVFGLICIILKRIKYFFKGYTSPTFFSPDNIDQFIEYDINVTRSWLDHLERYKGKDYDLEEKKVLELGPGSDLGTGVLLLMKGAEEYRAIDAYNLAEKTPMKFYRSLIKKAEDLDDRTTKPKLDQILENIDFVHNEDFDLSVLGIDSADIVFSQAAFEHFNDVRKTISQLSKVVRSGGILITEVDLQTHGQPLRDMDPLNIYRYPESLYDLLKTDSFHNRSHVDDYKKILKDEGWKDIEIIQIRKVNKEYHDHIRPHLSPKYQNYDDMRALSIMICATKG